MISASAADRPVLFLVSMKRSDNIYERWRIADIMLWLVPVLLLVPNLCLDITEIRYSTLDKAMNVLVPGGVYMLLFALSRRIGATTLWFLPVMVLCAFQIVLLFLYGESIIAIDMFLNVLTTNVHEATELLRNLTLAIFLVCLLYLPPLVIAVILSVKKISTHTSNRKIAVIVGIVMVLAGTICWSMNSAYRLDRLMFPVNVISNIFGAADRTRLSDNYFATSADFRFDAKVVNTDSTAVFVLVIGETARADNWQLNGYSRPTNPLLSQRRGLVSYTRALSESNTTHKSVPLLMSHLDPEHFGDSIYCSKGIIDAFKEAGFATACFSNQQRNGSIIDFFCAQADTVRFITDDGALHYDTELSPCLEGFIDAHPDRNLFVVLHTYGCHFNYKERYPESFDYFKPDNSVEAEPSNRPSLINAYDNAVRFNDTVIDSVLSVLASSGRPAAMVYLADHGEDIYDDRRERFLHASPTPTYWQIHVPMLVWLSDGYRVAHPDKFDILLSNSGRNVSSSRSAFHTMLSLAGVSTGRYKDVADLSSRTYKEPPRVFLNDYNESVPLKNSGLRQFDYDELKAHRISY